MLSESITSYSYNNGTIYYTTYLNEADAAARNRERHALSVLNLSNHQTQKIADAASWDNAYSYVSAANGVHLSSEWCRLDPICWNKHTGVSEPINKGASVTALYSQNGYVIAHFARRLQNPYRLMVFAPSGKTMKQVCATADVSDKAVINENGLLLYRLSGTKQLVMTQLPT